MAPQKSCDFLKRTPLKHKSKMTGDWCVFDSFVVAQTEKIWFIFRMKRPVYFKFHRRSVRLMKTSYLWWLKDIDYKIVNNAKLFSNVKISLILKKIHSWYQQFSNFHTCLLKTQHLTADCSDEKRNLVCKSFAKLLFLATGDNFFPKKAGQMILWKQN